MGFFTDDTQTAPARQNARRRPRPEPLPRGAAFGRYVILDHLATGGMGEVYAAWDPKLDRKVALKRLRSGVGDREAEARLLREARALARLNHPNVVALHEVGTHEDVVFLAMEHVDGEPLNEWLKKAPRTKREILDAFIEAGRGLAAAHASGLVHRDFKPHNVIIGHDGRIRVLDFGLARDGTGTDPGFASDITPASAPEEEGRASALTAVTQDGKVLGTPGYMAPEQLRGDPLDPRTDQYAFCLSLYEALFGQPAFSEKRPDKLAEAMEAEAIAPPPRGRRVSRRVQRALWRGLAGAPHRRFGEMTALLAELAPPRRLFGRAAAVATGTFLGALLSLGGVAVTTRAPAFSVPQPQLQQAAHSALAAAEAAMSRQDHCEAEGALRHAADLAIQAGDDRLRAAALSRLVALMGARPSGVDCQGR